MVAMVTLAAEMMDPMMMIVIIQTQIQTQILLEKTTLTSDILYTFTLYVFAETCIKLIAV